MNIDLVVVRPTRGLEFAESSESIERELQAFEGRSRILRSWSQIIPHSFNDLTVRALGCVPSLIWFVEEDVVVPAGALLAMMAMHVDIAAINYPLKVGGPGRLSALRDDKGEIYSLSLGCTLVRDKVFRVCSWPWFRTDLAPGTRHTGSAAAGPVIDLVPNHFEYGGHDGYFTLRAKQKGCTLGCVPDLLCRHLRLDAMGRPGTNDGCHAISAVD